MRLRDDARVLREIGHSGVIVVVDVLLGVRKHEGGMDRAIDVDETEQRVSREIERVVAEVPELNVGDAQLLGRRLGLLAALGLTRSRVMPSWRQSLALSPRSP